MMKENDPSIELLPEQLVTVILLGSTRRAHDCRETEKNDGHSFNMYALSSCYIPSTVPGTEEIAMNKTDKFYLHETLGLTGKTSHGSGASNEKKLWNNVCKCQCCGQGWLPPHPDWRVKEGFWRKETRKHKLPELAKMLNKTLNDLDPPLFSAYDKLLFLLLFMLWN